MFLTTINCWTSSFELLSKLLMLPYTLFSNVWSDVTFTSILSFPLVPITIHLLLILIFVFWLFLGVTLVANFVTRGTVLSYQLIEVLSQNFYTDFSSFFVLHFQTVSAFSALLTYSFNRTTIASSTSHLIFNLDKSLLSVSLLLCKFCM